MDTQNYQRFKTVKKINNPGDVHFITFSCFKRQPLLASERAKDWFIDALSEACPKHQMDLNAYVIMPDHVHLLLSPLTEEYSISAFLRSLKPFVTRKALHFLEATNANNNAFDMLKDTQPNGKITYRFWQRGGGYDRNIYSLVEFTEKLNYIHDNPVKSGHCERPEDYQWSSAADYAGTRTGKLPVKIPKL